MEPPASGFCRFVHAEGSDGDPSPEPFAHGFLHLLFPDHLIYPELEHVEHPVGLHTTLSQVAAQQVLQRQNGMDSQGSRKSNVPLIK